MTAKNSKDILKFVQEDDFVEYFLFPTETFADNEREQKLKTLLDNVNKVVKEYTADYIWQRDSFNLVAKTSDHVIFDVDNQAETVPPHLHGTTHYGDNIEDEWFIVYLLKQVTKEVDGLIARIIDSDGEFLLIEAADYLPSWANPDSCDRRVYIYRGQLHILAPQSENDNSITTEKALEQVYKNSSFTIAPEPIQRSVDRRIKEYPSKIKDNQHQVNLFLPVGVAALLNEDPTLVAAATTAFCNRDVIDMKYCRAMKYFPPEVRVKSRVSFTKCLYAMIANSRYQPDRKTGWNLPNVNSEEYKGHSLGMKLACGFEILVAQAKPDVDLENDKAWIKYLEKLKEKGYFRGLLEHSKEYNKLLEKAKEYYRQAEISNAGTSSVGKRILNTLKNLDYTYESMKELEKNLPEADDDESWLHITPDELDKMLEEQYGHPSTLKLNQNTDATKFTESLSSFLNHVSDVDGAEFPNAPPRPPRARKGKVSFSEGSSDNKVNFDPSSFACAVQDILNFVIPEDEAYDSDSDSDMSDYGKEENLCGGMNEMKQLMDEMDRELAGTTVGQSFSNVEGNAFDDVEEFKPVDIDVNALKNILESYKSQMGEAGPSSTMLGPMGIHLDENKK